MTGTLANILKIYIQFCENKLTTDDQKVRIAWMYSFNIFGEKMNSYFDRILKNHPNTNEVNNYNNNLRNSRSSMSSLLSMCGNPRYEKQYQSAKDPVNWMYDAAENMLSKETKDQIVDMHHLYMDPNFPINKIDCSEKALIYIYRKLPELYCRWIKTRDQTMMEFNNYVQKFQFSFTEFSDFYVFNKIEYVELDKQLEFAKYINNIYQDYAKLDKLAEMVSSQKVNVNVKANNDNDNNNNNNNLVDYNAYTAPALRKLCDHKNIKVKKSAKKEELISALQNPNQQKEEEDEKIIKVVKKEATPKRTIPKRIRTELWKVSFGDTLNGKCYVCDRNLEIDNFEAGHIISEKNGGDIVIDNLKVVCKPCNTSCGTRNLEDFKKSLNGNKQNK